MTEPLIAFTVAGAVAGTWWVLPRIWWASFSREDRWTPFVLTQPAVADTGINVTRIVTRRVTGTPTLEAIDRIRGDEHRPFASDPNAMALERAAIEYIDQTWSETVWLTGCIDEPHFEALCRSLDQQRTLPVSAAAPVVVRERPAETLRIAR
jgi:hypothetical protein